MTIPSFLSLSGEPFVVGQASGEVLSCETELSFWGGVEPEKGEIIDQHHPLCGHFLQGKILVLPGGRGSCSGSGVILEMMVNGKGPDAIIISRPDDIITLGVWIAQEMFDKSIPVVMLEADEFEKISNQKYASIIGEKVQCSEQRFTTNLPFDSASEKSLIWNEITLSDYDRSLLNGEKSLAAQVAMKVILHMAKLAGAKALIDVSQVHIDGCIYTGEASLRFAQKLHEMGGEFAVPTSLNSISVDYLRWESQGVPSDFGTQASALADAYVAMGAKATFTCAPYLLDTAPEQGEQIAWAESNAVVFANSVLGARTMKYPDFLDACIALTGRAPLAGAHINEYRKATLQITLNNLPAIDDLFYPLLGYYVGKLAGNRIPVVDGAESLEPDLDDLKAFGAAFATVSSAAMFHITGVTPEAKTLDHVLADTHKVEKVTLLCSDLFKSWEELSGAKHESSDLISLGNPHFSFTEFEKLARLCAGKSIAAKVSMYITAGRAVVAQAEEAGYIKIVEDFGAEIITDTCWCMIQDPIIPHEAKVICTNSAKYAHYGPGMTGRAFKFLGLGDCVQEAITGSAAERTPEWLT
ncbi:cis-3-hydroxy-L-proline dehydratase [Marinomonas colpomeniae]|uniref:cis-3-hydroxy-L-proline dehydratase n=1 Tax=Marinomonas colpomeniae TaxID=2774408 RepID=UPI0019D68FE8|nr:aconitase X [Marinomonas colpomeniae]